MSGQRRELDLSAARALIFRITHIQNVPWILDHGLRCRNSVDIDPNFVSIGNPELIDKRRRQAVHISPYGHLADYIPFYFTPFSVMLLNIKTGYNGIIRRANEDIVIIVTTLHQLVKDGVNFLFTDKHASRAGANFFTDLCDLESIDWPILRARDFKRDLDDLEKFERYQAESLIHQGLSTSSMLGFGCFNERAAGRVKTLVDERKLALPVHVRPGWYF